jgi:hypothetical protein
VRHERVGLGGLGERAVRRLAAGEVVGRELEIEERAVRRRMRLRFLAGHGAGRPAGTAAWREGLRGFFERHGPVAVGVDPFELLRVWHLTRAELAVAVSVNALEQVLQLLRDLLGDGGARHPRATRTGYRHADELQDRPAWPARHEQAGHALEVGKRLRQFDAARRERIVQRLRVADVVGHVAEAALER